MHDTTPGEPTPSRPGLVGIGLGVLGFVVAGLVVGFIWDLVAPLPRFRLESGRVLLAVAEDETAVAADGWFAVCSAVAGILSAVVVFARVRAARLAALGALTLGGLLAALVAWRVGVALGPDPVTEQVQGLRDGARLDGPLRLGALGVLLAWPLASIVTYFALATGLEPSRPRPAPARGVTPDSAGARFPVTRFRPGYSVEEVDRFFARLETGAVTDAEVVHVQFSSTRGGYDEEAVDDALTAVRSRTSPDTR